MNSLVINYIINKSTMIIYQSIFILCRVQSTLFMLKPSILYCYLEIFRLKLNKICTIAVGFFVFEHHPELYLLAMNKRLFPKLLLADSRN